MRRFLIVYISMALALISCVKEDFGLRDSFQQEGGVYAVRGNEVLFSFDENTCQWAYQPATKVFKIFDDNYSNWLIFDCKGANLTEGTTFYANLQWTSGANIPSLRNLSFQLMKVVDGVYYFWCSSHNIALRLRME